MRSDSANLNVLRAIAVICVFGSHVVQYCSSDLRLAVNLGHAGVLLFFVHTSLVLMFSLERQGDEMMWRRFVLRRIFRVYPLAMCAVVIYSIFRIPSIVSYHQLHLPHLRISVLASNLFLIQNLLQFDSVPAVLWSLPFEMQMYLLLPALFLLIRNRSGADSITLWVVAVAGSLVLMATCPAPVASLFQYFPCFTAGVVAYAIKPRPILPTAAFSVFVLLIVALYLPINPAFVAPQWPLCLALGCGIPMFREMRPGAVSTVAASIARYSFGIYLFHEAALVLTLPWTGWIGAAPAFLLTLSVSVVAYRFVEQPLIALGHKLTSQSATRELTARLTAKS